MDMYLGLPLGRICLGKAAAISLIFDLGFLAALLATTPATLNVSVCLCRPKPASLCSRDNFQAPSSKSILAPELQT